MIAFGGIEPLVAMLTSERGHGDEATIDMREQAVKTIAIWHR